MAVTTAGGNGTIGGFTFVPPPTITSFSPVNAITGNTVTITGTNFTGASLVRFGGANASSFTVISATEISAVVGTGLSGNVSVTTVGGMATLAGFNYTGITSFSPTSATIGTTVTITGTNLSGTTAVSFGGVPPTSFTNVSATNVTAVVSNGASGIVSLTTPVGIVTRTGFTYIIPVPVITNFTPTSAANRAMVTITGNHFNGATSVKFGSVNAYSFTVINNTTIEAVVAHGATGSVTVTTPGGTGTLAGFTFIPNAPTITTFSPASSCASGTTITIRGLNFTGVTSVQFDGVSTAFTLLSDTVITVISGAVNNSGAITVTTPNGTFKTTNNFVMGSGVPAFLPNPSPFQLCAGSPRVLSNINLPGAFTYVCSNGQSGNAITISSAGSYTLTATDEYGCSNTAAFTVANYANCGGYIEIESEPVFNYFDTLHVKVKIKNGVNIFSTFAYLNFNPAHLKYVASQPGDYLGPNVLYQPAVVTGGQIDFGMSHITGDPGTNGDGLIYEFQFVLANQMPNLATFNAVKPNSFTTSLTLNNLSFYNVSGVQPPSFAAISMLTKPVACRYYVPVWPGDLNFDKKVNVADILPIGYFYSSTGPVRPNANLQWLAQPSALWGFDKTNKNSSAYKTFADGTPDGLINLADQTSIGFNLSRFHNRYINLLLPPAKHVLNVISRPDALTNVPAINVSMPDVSIAASSLPLNEIVTISLGSPTFPLNNVYGIAFDIFFNPAAVNVNAITSNYTGSIFGTLNTNFTRIEDRTGLASGRFSVGITRYNTTGITASGGNILTVTLPLITAAPGGIFKVTAIPIGCNNPVGEDLAVAGGSDFLMINSAQTCNTNYWQGTVSNEWENPENWSCGSIPGVNSVVFITAGNPHLPEIKSMATCKRLQNSSGTSIKIKSGFKLDITGVN